jgi:hypothetical protein
MSVPDILIALLLGAIFGWVLDKGGLNRYYKIANVFCVCDGGSREPCWWCCVRHRHVPVRVLTGHMHRGRGPRPN